MRMQKQMTLSSGIELCPEFSACHPDTTRDTQLQRFSFALKAEADRLEKLIKKEQRMGSTCEKTATTSSVLLQSQLLHITSKLLSGHTFKSKSYHSAEVLTPPLNDVPRKAHFLSPVERLCSARQPSEKPRIQGTLLYNYTCLFVISKGKSRVQPQSLRWDLKSLWKCCGKESRNNDGAQTALANSFMIARIFSRQEVKTNLILRSWQPIAAYFQLGSTSMSYRVVFLTMWCVRVNWTPSPV